MGVLILASLPGIAILAYQLYGLSRSGYDIDRNAVTIQWGAIRQIVPVEAIQRIMLATELEYGVSGFRGWRWPGLMQGHGELPEAGLTLFYASTALQNQIHPHHAHVVVCDFTRRYGRLHRIDQGAL